MTIKQVTGCKEFDGRGFWALKVKVITDSGEFSHTISFDTKDDSSVHADVNKAVNLINSVIGPALIAKDDLDICNQESVDDFLVGIRNPEEHTGMRAPWFAISAAICKAGAHKRGIPLHRYIANLSGVEEFVFPVPAFRAVNGGNHDSNKLPFKEVMFLPIGANCFSEAITMGTQMHAALRTKLLESFGFSGCIAGDEGGYTPNLQIDEALELLVEVINICGYQGRVCLGVDVDANSFFKNDVYDLTYKDLDGPKNIKSADEMLKMYETLINKFPIISLEDPFQDDDVQSWTRLRTAYPQIDIFGEWLTEGSLERLKVAALRKTCNCVCLVLLETLTVSDAINTSKAAHTSGLEVVMTYRVIETEDTFAADLCVGLGVRQIHTGTTKQHLSRFNQILYTEQQLGTNAKFAGVLFKSQQKSASENIDEDDVEDETMLDKNLDEKLEEACALAENLTEVLNVAKDLQKRRSEGHDNGQGSDSKKQKK